MPWNSRIFVQRHPGGDVYGMRETFYNDTGQIVAWDEKFEPVLGDSVDDLIKSLRQQLRDAKRSREVLDADMEPEGTPVCRLPTAPAGQAGADGTGRWDDEPKGDMG